MSVKSEIERIKTNISNALSAVSEAGVDVSTLDNSDTLPDLIKQIPTGTDTSDATATTSDILVGKTAYVNGEKITGVIETKTESDLIFRSGGCELVVPSGYYATDGSYMLDEAIVSSSLRISSSGLVSSEINLIGEGYMREDGLYGGVSKQITSEDEPTLLPENIVRGVSIFGVTGTAETGSGSIQTAAVTISIEAPLSMEGSLCYVSSDGLKQIELMNYELDTTTVECVIPSIVTIVNCLDAGDFTASGDVTVLGTDNLLASYYVSGTGSLTYK